MRDEARDLDRRRRRRTAALIGAVGVAVIAGMAALGVFSGERAATPPTPSASATPTLRTTETPTSTPTVTTAPSPTSTPTPISTATAPAPLPDDPSTWVVTDAGMGPLFLGMPFADAITAVPGAEDACTHAYMAFDIELWIVGWPVEYNGAPGPLDVVAWGQGPAALTSGGPRTPGGLGLGSSEAEVRAQYPDAVEVLRHGLNLQAGNVFFAIDESTGTVDEIGVTSEDIPYEYCA